MKNSQKDNKPSEARGCPPSLRLVDGGRGFAYNPFSRLMEALVFSYPVLD